MRHELTEQDIERVRERVDTYFIQAASHSGGGWRAELLFDVAYRQWVVRDHGEPVFRAASLGEAVEAYNQLRPRVVA